MTFHEMNFDGLIGPTHNYSGLAVGNLASAKNAKNTSFPREAALQGIEKMRTLVRKGYKQGFLLPNARPDLNVLRNLGFTGTNAQIINKAAKQAPELLSMVYSASSMWAANAATVTPSLDSKDGKVHFTPANLLTTAHRAIEYPQTERILKAVFNNTKYFKVHSALYGQSEFADEGAANHTRLGSSYQDAGVGLFVYGRTGQSNLTRFPARQTLKASQAVARAHETRDALFLQQSPVAIDAGAFHNDVVAVGNGPALFFHEDAFVASQQAAVFAELAERMPFKAICVSRDDVSLADAISSYLFNSQLLASPDGSTHEMHLIAPTECRDNQAVFAYLERLIADDSQPIRTVTYVDVRQSMSNGGGPACLRLRVLMSNEEMAAINPNFIATEAQLDVLSGWVNQHYRDELSPADLADPQLMTESYDAFTDLEEVLNCEGVYRL
ncbi:N-succinylarginine dihydrolase [Umboniibacter marinipuniceus]|uniref:N-succinylarginine dihydrolase n=1 Tax=Umboniibacter marinipuniceus TaxID=569599 RepID=A0A3L9ZY46_9GAMM|nr:N-succinylarginine dihydrolase [Umboniibacter marinipuniceus]RMA77643.1 succinylarginine dihydrolase [Umboniibacter marinipuniceus]